MQIVFEGVLMLFIKNYHNWSMLLANFLRYSVYTVWNFPHDNSNDIHANKSSTANLSYCRIAGCCHVTNVVAQSHLLSESLTTTAVAVSHTVAKTNKASYKLINIVTNTDC